MRSVFPPNIFDVIFLANYTLTMGAKQGKGRIYCENRNGMEWMESACDQGSGDFDGGEFWLIACLSRMSCNDGAK